jgi:pyruvate/2-oxoglutarate/acetoin dehydrogenase E1 component
MAAKVIEQGFDLLEEPISRVAGLDLPIANTRALEEKILPQTSDIKKAITEVVQ